MEDRNRWIRLIKKLRTEHQVSILDAERIALSNPDWRRWVEHQINVDRQCRKMARYHLRVHGDASLIEVVGDRLQIR